MTSSRKTQQPPLVFIVDSGVNDMYVFHVLRPELWENGYETIIIEDGSGVEVMLNRGWFPDCIVMDYGLRHSEKLLKAIAEHSKDIPVVLYMKEALLPELQKKQEEAMRSHRSGGRCKGFFRNGLPKVGEAVQVISDFVLPPD